MNYLTHPAAPPEVCSTFWGNKQGPGEIAAPPAPRRLSDAGLPRSRGLGWRSTAYGLARPCAAAAAAFHIRTISLQSSAAVAPPAAAGPPPSYIPVAQYIANAFYGRPQSWPAAMPASAAQGLSYYSYPVS